MYRSGLVRDRDADFPTVLELKRQVDAHQTGKIGPVDGSLDRTFRRIRHAVAEQALENLYLIADGPEHAAFQQQLAVPGCFLDQLDHPVILDRPTV